MNYQHDHQENDSVGAYVLDALEPEEHAQFETHLQTCEMCRREVAELMQVVDVLPLAVERVEPPSRLKDRLLDSVADETPARSALRALPGGAPPREKRAFINRYKVALGLVAAVIIAALGIWNVRLQNQITDQKNSLAYQQDVNRAILSGAAVTPLAPAANSPAEAAMVQPKHGGAPYLLVRNLPPTPANKVYELWYMRGTTPTAVKVFTYAGNEPQIVPLAKSSTPYSLAAITLERGPHGTTAPTTKPIVLGKLNA